MKKFSCLIQEGQGADRSQALLEEGLRRIGREAFGDDPAESEVAWTVFGRGFAWTAGEPSTSSVVIGSVPAGLPLERREPFLREICSLWERVTGCSTDEIVATAWDGPLPL